MHPGQLSVEAQDLRYYYDDFRSMGKRSLAEPAQQSPPPKATGIRRLVPQRERKASMNRFYNPESIKRFARADVDAEKAFGGAGLSSRLLDEHRRRERAWRGGVKRQADRDRDRHGGGGGHLRGAQVVGHDVAQAEDEFRASMGRGGHARSHHEETTLASQRSAGVAASLAEQPPGGALQGARAEAAPAGGGQPEPQPSPAGGRRRRDPSYRDASVENGGKGKGGDGDVATATPAAAPRGGITSAQFEARVRAQASAKATCGFRTGKRQVFDEGNNKVGAAGDRTRFYGGEADGRARRAGRTNVTARGDVVYGGGKGSGIRRAWNATASTIVLG